MHRNSSALLQEFSVKTRTAAMSFPVNTEHHSVQSFRSCSSVVEYRLSTAEHKHEYRCAPFRCVSSTVTRTVPYSQTSLEK